MVNDFNGWTVEGFRYDEIIFHKNGSYVLVKSNLKKQDLVLKLGINSKDIDTSLRNDILDAAKDKGRKYCYTKEGYHTSRDHDIVTISSECK